MKLISQKNVNLLFNEFVYKSYDKSQPCEASEDDERLIQLSLGKIIIIYSK
jgi:hypothetical protein